MIPNLNKDLDVTLTLCHSVTHSMCLCVCVCVRLEVVSSHLPAVMLWLASSLQACCQQEVSSAQCSHQHTAGSVLTADINGHTFTHTNVLENAQIYTLHSAITWLSHVCAYFSIKVHVMQTKGLKMCQNENVAVMEGSLPLVHQSSL